METEELRVLVVLSGGGFSGSATLRQAWPASVLMKDHPGIKVVPISWQLDVWIDDDGKPRQLVKAPDFDVIYLQRVQSRHMIESFPLLQAAGVAVVVDIDDDFASVHRQNIAWKAVTPKSNPDSNWHHLETACRTADLVTVSTPLLAKIYAPHGRFAVLPNRLPERIGQFTHVENSPLQVGWPGDIRTHPRDLQVTRGMVAQAMAGTDAEFVTVGPVDASSAMGITTPSKSTGMVPMSNWHATINAHVDIGLVPLEPGRFNGCKSGLKLLEMGSMGIPVVATPTPDNQRLMDLGIGAWARKPKDWYREVRRLIDDEGWRKELGQRSQEAARKEALEAHAEDWWSAWLLARDFHDWKHG